MVDVEYLFLVYKPHIVAIKETWLHDRVLDSEVTLPDYSIFWRDRGAHGGGAAFDVSKNIDAILLEKSENIEAIWLKVTSLLGPIVIGTV